MIVDTSALAAILLNEPDYPRFRETLLAAERVSISASNVIELDMLALRRAGAEGELLADALIDEFGIEVIPVDKGQIRVARNGFRLYGKGRHPAGLNYGDLFAYALSKITGEPLLFKGEDFSKTDVVAAL